MKEVTGKAVADDDLSRLKGRFEQWRAVRKVGARIPAALWAGAVDAAAVHGICRVAVTLRLDYPGLKRRSALAGSNATQPVPQEAPRFAEFFAPVGPAASAVVASSSSLQPVCVIELTNSRGAAMRVELNSACALAGLSSLCSAFWAS